MTSNELASKVAQLMRSEILKKSDVEIEIHDQDDFGVYLQVGRHRLYLRCHTYGAAAKKIGAFASFGNDYASSQAPKEIHLEGGVTVEQPGEVSCSKDREPQAIADSFISRLWGSFIQYSELCDKRFDDERQKYSDRHKSYIALCKALEADPNLTQEGYSRAHDKKPLEPFHFKESTGTTKEGIALSSFGSFGADFTVTGIPNENAVAFAKELVKLVRRHKK